MTCLPSVALPPIYASLLAQYCGVGEDLSIPWTARRSNQSILKEISPENSLEGLC